MNRRAVLRPHDGDIGGRRGIDHDRVTEFAEACRQVERIAEIRLRDLLPS